MKILVLSPHTDDAEFCAGATISQFIEMGYDVFYMVFSTEDYPLLKDRGDNYLKYECLNAIGKLGVLRENVTFLDYKSRTFSVNRQSILQDIYNIGQTIHPDIVLCPSHYDQHQDHEVVNKETIRVFKNSTTMWGYFTPRNVLKFSFDVIREVSEVQLQKKISAVLEYQSQMISRPIWFNKEFIIVSAKMFGYMIDRNYAECFESIREVKKI